MLTINNWFIVSENSILNLIHIKIFYFDACTIEVRKSHAGIRRTNQASLSDLSCGCIPRIGYCQRVGSRGRRPTGSDTEHTSR